jgi:hypothetical protein
MRLALRPATALLIATSVTPPWRTLSTNHGMSSSSVWMMRVGPGDA